MEPAIKKKPINPPDDDRGDDDEGKFHGYGKLARETCGLLLRGSEIAGLLFFMVRRHINCPGFALAQPIKLGHRYRLLQLTGRSSLGPDVWIAPLRDQPKCSHNFIT